MAHFARLENNLVTQVIVVNNSILLDGDGNEQESLGLSFCQSLYGNSTVWKQTSYNNNLRKNFAGIGYSYDTTRDAFIPPQPYSSWLLDETTCQWDPPIPYPNDPNYYYQWDESTISWVQTGPIILEPENN